VCGIVAWTTTKLNRSRLCSPTSYSFVTTTAAPTKTAKYGGYLICSEFPDTLNYVSELRRAGWNDPEVSLVRATVANFLRQLGGDIDGDGPQAAPISGRS
jgi:hypothetical protein